MNIKEKTFKEFKEFLADECAVLAKYKAGRYDKKIYQWFSSQRKELIGEIDVFIAEEMVIAYKAGEPTSRLTSLAVKLNKMNNKKEGD